MNNPEIPNSWTVMNKLEWISVDKYKYRFNEDDGFEREVKFYPAFKDEKYGISPVKIEMILRGNEGCVINEIITNWFLDSVNSDYPNGSLITWHSKNPSYSQDKIDCNYLKQGFCYGGHFFVTDQRNLTLLKTEGSDGIWKYLKEIYMQKVQNKE